MSLFKLTFSSDDSKTSQITLQTITAKNLANYLSLKFIKFLPFQVLIQLPVDGFLGFFSIPASPYLFSVTSYLDVACCLLQVWDDALNCSEGPLPHAHPPCLVTLFCV